MTCVLDVLRLAAGIAGVATIVWLVGLVVPIGRPAPDEEWW